MSAFKRAELEYLTGERRLARVATVGKDGTPHVVPVGFSYNAEHETIDIRGHSLEALDGSTPLIRIYPERVRSWGLQRG